MALQFDLFWSFRSPYSSLAAGRSAALQREYRVDANARPVSPLAVREPSFFATATPLSPPYVPRDATRIAEMLRIPSRWPTHDPIVRDCATCAVAKEQP